MMVKQRTKTLLLIACALGVGWLGLRCQSMKKPPASNLLPNPGTSSSDTLPIVYHEGYNIRFGGLEKLHPFDSEKYGRVAKRLLARDDIAGFHSPEAIQREDLLRVHSAEYLDSLQNAKTLAQIAELPFVTILPDGKVRKHLLSPMQLATGGTLLATRLAIDPSGPGWAINLSGGYHHAKAISGEGFCALADIPVAAHALWASNPTLRILVIDLDAHQGNGISSVFGDDERVRMLDIYNDAIYPNDEPAAAFVEDNYPIPSGTGDDAYFNVLTKALPASIAAARPDLIFYNAGTDVYKDDPLGALALTREGIIKRDEMVFTAARNQDIPIVMVLSGGYTKESAGIIADSIESLLDGPLSSGPLGSTAP